MIRSKKYFVSLFVCLFLTSCIEEKPQESPWVPEDTAAEFLKKLEVHYTGLYCKNDRHWGNTTCTANIDGNMKKIECDRRVGCEFSNK